MPLSHLEPPNRFSWHLEKTSLLTMSQGLKKKKNLPLREGNGNPLQYSCLGNPMDRGARQATVHGVARLRHNLATESPPPLLTFLTTFCTLSLLLRAS